MTEQNPPLAPDPLQMYLMDRIPKQNIRTLEAMEDDIAELIEYKRRPGHRIHRKAQMKNRRINAQGCVLAVSDSRDRPHVQSEQHYRRDKRNLTGSAGKVFALAVRSSDASVIDSTANSRARVATTS